MSRPLPSRTPLRLSSAERAMLEDTWPIELVTDPSRQPLEVFTPTDYAAFVLAADHLDDVVVFRDGARSLGIDRKDALPPWVGRALDAAKSDDGCSVLDFLRHVVAQEPDVAGTLKAGGRREFPGRVDAAAPGSGVGS